MRQSIEQRLAAALTNDAVSLETVAELIVEAEHAALQAEATADQVRGRSLEDLTCDVEEPSKIVAAAELRRDRLRIALPKLRAKLATALAREIEERWLARAARLQTKIDALATEFRDTYPPAVQTLLDLFIRCRELEAEVSMHNSQAPAGGHHLLGPELTARCMLAFSTKEPSVIMGTVLLDPHDSKQIWPPVTIPLSVIAAAAQPVLPGHSCDWRAERQALGESRNRDWQRVTEYHADQERQRKEREEQEDKLRLEADRAAKRACFGPTAPA
jgi:hypothetical protein